jgi:putative membrane protein
MNELPKDPRVYMAAERTFLAWIRTGLAFMAFGFVVARFGIFLRSLAATTNVVDLKSPRWSVAAGTALIVLGVLIQIFSSVHYRRLIKDLNAGRADFDKPSALASGVAVLVAVFGAVMAVYLLITRPN